jgi:hypothetical protein
MRRSSSIGVVVLASLVLPRAIPAQIRASEIGSVSQIIDGTKITLEYSRPRSRGRDTLFGTKAVQWGETWTPGANWATTLDVSRAVKLNGHPVSKGKYSVWMVVRQNREWTVVLDPQAHRYHMEPPDSSGAQIRFPVRVEAGPFTDVLTWSMPELRISGATLVMQWERARVPIDVEVEPTLVMTLPAADAVPYLGTYAYAERDSTGKAGKVLTFTISHEDGTLKGRWDPEDEYMRKFALIRIAPDWFVPGVYDDKGQIYEVLKPDMVFEFTRTRGRVTSLVVRNEADQVQATATRTP